MLSKWIGNGSYNIVKLLFTFVFAILIFQNTIYGQQIVTDGNTATNLNINGSTTTVTTGTMQNQGAFNSFSRFNVNQGNTVNMIVPSQANFLMNLVHNEASQINGILNSIKSGAIGGNVIFVNPHGIFVGSTGVLNVGSLTAITPTQSFMGSIITAPGVFNNSSVNALLGGTAPINPDGVFENDGLINAATDVRIDTGSFTNSGEVNTGAVYQTEKTLSLSNVDPGDVVNINKIDSPTRFGVKSGELVVNAKKDITNSGKLNTVGGNNTNAGNIRLVSNVDVFLRSGSEINAVGKGQNSSGGNVFVRGDDYLSFSDNSKINSTGGKISGNGGSVDLNSKGYLIYRGDVNTYGNKGSSGDISLDTDLLIIASNIYSGGADINITSDSMAYVIDDFVLSARNVGNNPSANQFSAFSVGSSGNININTQSITFCPGSKLLSFANNGYKPGNISVVSNYLNTDNTGVQFNAGEGDITLSRKTPGDILIKNDLAFYIPSYETDIYRLGANDASRFVSKNLNIGNHSSTNNNTKSIYLAAELKGRNVNISVDNSILNFYDSLFFAVKPRVIATENITLNARKGSIGSRSSYLKIDTGSRGILTATAANDIYLKEVVGDMRVNQIKSTNNGDVGLAVSWGSILNSSPGNLTNVIAKNLYLRNDYGRYFYLGIYDDPFYENTSYNITNLYLDLFKKYGANWAAMPASNFSLLNTNLLGGLNKKQILKALSNMSDVLTDNDVFVITYYGHGGIDIGPDFNPIDENNGIALNTADEFLAFNEGFNITDDEFASRLSNTKGNIVYITDQCFGGGMFGGNSDLDQVADKNGFKFYGMTAAREGYNAIAFPYDRLDGALTGTMSIFLTDLLESAGSEIPKITDGNLTFADWFNAVDFKQYYDISPGSPLWFENFTNMTASDLGAFPLLVTDWTSPVGAMYLDPLNIGTIDRPFTVNLSGNLVAYSQDLINISGNWKNADVHSLTNNIILNSFPLQSEFGVARDLAVIQQGSTLDMIYDKEVFDMVTYPDFGYFDQPAPFFTNYDNNVYLDITFENYTRNILNSVVDSYVEVYKNTASEQKALEIAVMKMESAKFTPEIVAQLIKRKTFNRNDQMVKIMEYYINNRTLKVSNGY